MSKKLGAAWHIHDDQLLDFLSEPIENRIAFIKESKLPSEVPLRLRLLKKVKGKLPAAYVKASAAYDKAYTAYDKASAAYDKAYDDYLPEIEALHKKECADCPWSSEQQTIFTRTNKKGEWY
mgnify:CR=1 FL=1